MLQAGGIRPLTGETVAAGGYTLAAHHTPIGFVALEYGEGDGVIGDLPHGAEGVGEVVSPICACVFCDAANPIEVCGGAIAQHLGEASVEIKGVSGGDGIRCLPQAVAEAVVGEGVCDAALRDTEEVVGLARSEKEIKVLQNCNNQQFHV